MKFDSIFQEIQQVDPGSEPLKVKEPLREAFLKSWLKQYPQKAKTPEIDLLARKIALELANHDVPQAFKLLYPQFTLEITGKFPEQHFLDRKFYTESSTQGLNITSLKHWSKVAPGTNQTPIGSLIVLYEAALKEVKDAKVPAWIQIEAYESLKASFDKPLHDAVAFVLQRKNRLAALMLDPSTLLPAMQSYWQAYQAFYNAHNQTADIQTELTAAPNMGIPSYHTAPIETTLPDNPTIQALSDFRKHQTHSLDYHEVIKEFKKAQNAKQFLAQRKNTRTSSGYTADPKSPANLFCAKVAALLVDQSKDNPREQFWTLLYPHLQGVYLGHQDKDWPNYGEALLWGDQLVNYRKLGLMAQHRDAHKIMIGQDEDRIVDTILSQSLLAIPSYKKITLDECGSLECFNPADKVFWKSSVSTQFGNNAFEFFSKVLAVLDKYRATEDRNAELENEMSLEGLKAMAPYTQYLHTSNLVEQLRAYSKKIPANATVIHEHLNNLMTFGTRMMKYDGSCYNSAHKDIEAALTAIKEILRDEITFKDSQFIQWKPDIQGKDTCPPAPDHTAILGPCLQAIPNNQVLIEWTAFEAKQGRPLPIEVVAQRFIELASRMSVTKIFNFVLTHLPNDGNVLFADQIGHENGLAFTRNTFLQKLFPNGIELSQTTDPSDFTCAMKFHLHYGVKGKEQTISKAIEHLKNTTGYKDPKYFPEIQQLLVFLISGPSLSDSDMTSIIKNTSLSSNLPLSTMGTFLSLFENDVFPKALDHIEKQLVKKGAKTFTFPEGLGNDDSRTDAGNYSIATEYIIQIFAALSNGSSKTKKHLMIFDRFLPYFQGSWLNGQLKNFYNFIDTLFNLYEILTKDNIPALIAITCLAAYKGGKLQEDHFTDALAVALNVFQDFILDENNEKMVEAVFNFGQSEQVLEIDSIDQKMNLFRKLFKTIYTPAALGILLKRLDVELYSTIFSNTQKLGLHSCINTYDDLIQVWTPLSPVQRSYFPMTNHPDDLKKLSAEQQDNLVAILVTSGYIRNWTDLYKLTERLTEAQMQKAYEIFALHRSALFKPFEFITSSLPVNTFKAPLLSAIIRTNPATLPKISEYEDFVPRLITDGIITNQMLYTLFEKRPDLLSPAIITEHHEFLGERLSATLDLYIDKKYDSCKNNGVEENPLTQLSKFLIPKDKTMRTGFFLAIRSKFPAFSSIANHFASIFFHLIHSDNFQDNFKQLSKDEKCLLVQKCINEYMVAFLLKHSKKDVHRKEIIDAAMQNECFMPKLSPSMEPRELNTIFSCDDDSVKEILASMGDILERFKAIYQLLVEESFGGPLFHLRGAFALHNLAIDDVEGWKHVFSDPSSNEPGSLRCKALMIAVTPGPERRKRELMDLISVKYKVKAVVSNLIFSHRYQEPTHIDLPPDLLDRIHTVCNDKVNPSKRTNKSNFS